MKNANAGVLFQNADWSINMGVWFDDPDIEMDDIYWYDILAREMEYWLGENKDLISIDEDYNTKSCYVELHRNGE